MLKVKHPAPFNGALHKELAFVYAEKDGIRYNVRPKGEEGEGAAGILIDYDPNADYRELYEETEYKTLNPQD